MPLAIGSWRININGQFGELNIVAVAPAGVWNGVLNFPPPVGELYAKGTWNDPTQVITFGLLKPNAVGGADWVPLLFRGWLLKTPNEPPPGVDIQWTLVGSVLDPAQRGDLGLPDSSRRSEFGWFAEFTEVR